MQCALPLPDTYLLLSVQLELLFKVSEGCRLTVLRWHHIYAAQCRKKVQEGVNSACSADKRPPAKVKSLRYKTHSVCAIRLEAMHKARALD